MKIGIDARLWNETGVGRYIRNLVKQLLDVDKENNYTLFVLSRDYQEIEEKIAKKTNSWKIITADVRWHSFQEQLMLPQILNKEKVDLMHFPYFSVPVVYRRPFVVTIHDLIIHHFPTGKATTLPKPIYRLKRLGYKSTILFAVRNAERIIVPLETVKKDVMQTLHVPQGKIVITHEGFDANIADTKNEAVLAGPSFQYFLYVGNAYPHKNVATLVRAFLSLRNIAQYRDLQLVLVGKKDFFYERLLENIDNKKNNSIHIYNNVSDELLHVLYKNALAVVTPSFMEGFGLVPLEALSQSCLVVASDIPAHREVCGESAIFFDPQRPEDLQLALIKILTMKTNEKVEVRKKGLSRASLFSWKKMAEETLLIYKEVVSR